MTPTVHDWVAYNAARHPSAPALTSIERAVTMSWGELEQRVGRLSRGLVDAYALAPGDRVALIAENDTRSFELQFACMRAGLILVPINWRLAMGEMVTLMKDASPALMVHDEPWAETAAAVASVVGIKHTLEWRDSREGDRYEDLIEAATGVMAGARRSEATITHILYTSGTTGLPKGAMCSQGSLKHHALNLAHTSRVAERGSHHLNLVPLFHAGGLNVYSNPVLYWGGHVTTVRRFDPAVALRLLADPELCVTHLCGVLQMYELITAQPAFEAATFPSLRAALFGGWGPATYWVHRKWRERGFFLQLAYGSTENGPLMSVLEEGAALAEQNCSGAVLPGMEVRLVEDTGADVPSGAIGEVWVRGPSVTPGYWNRPREEYFVGDWFRTGDCARMDDAGRIYIVDRLREVYRSGGENVYPAEVELVLADMPGVKEVAVIGVPDERWGEVGLAVVEPHPGVEITMEAVLAHVGDRLARFKQPRRLVTIAEMPRNATLKLDRAALKTMFAASPHP